MRISVDKIGSVTRNLKLTRTLTLSDQIEAASGSVVVGRVLNEKNSYNQLEDPNGRMSTIQSGDLVVGALGHRNALQGYEGVLPTSVKVGQTLNLLNLGGVIGECTSHNPDVGKPFDLEILGQVLVFPDFQSRVGQSARIQMKALPENSSKLNIPVVYIAGTCMNAGKTAAACSIVRTLAQAGMRVGGAKLTGVSLIRDILAMRDYGAEHVFDFTDAGVVSSDETTAVATAHSIFGELQSRGCEVIVAETGDGIMGEYGVQSILADPELMALSKAFVLCANDPVGVAGSVTHLRERYGVETDVVAGPATDNRVGVRFVERTFDLPAINARTSSAAFGAFILNKLKGGAA